MKTFSIFSCLFSILLIPINLNSQTPESKKLPVYAEIELNRLDEAYTLLDQFAEKVWTGWNDYLAFPYLMTYQNGFRLLVGHPAPPAGFVHFPQKTVHGLSVYMDTSNLNDFKVQLPLRCGGGIIPYGDFNGKSVTIVNINLLNTVGEQSNSTNYQTAEDHILVYIHELMHCYQDKILPEVYGNLDLNPDLNFALYSEIEGLALQQAYEEDSREASLQYLKDFCIARKMKLRGMTEDEMNQARCDEFREGEAVYSEMTILHSIRDGFTGNLTPARDEGYSRFTELSRYIDKYKERLKESAGKTLELYLKNYDYGCFQALLLQRHFPGWQKSIESGGWLDPVLSQCLDIRESDSLLSVRRFTDVYHIGDLTRKHEKIINSRNDTYRMLNTRLGQTYIISFKPIEQYLPETIDKTRLVYKLGLIEMYPDGIGSVSFDDISLDMKEMPTEVNQLYYIKVVDVNPARKGKKYNLKYDSAEGNGIYHNVLITTPLFTLKAPMASIRERANRIKITLLSRT